MRVAVIKLGSRISFNSNDTSGGNGEARAIIKMLKHGGAEVHIFTKILNRDNLLPEYVWHDLQKAPGVFLPEVNELDALVVLNGSVNFFGGAEDREQLMNYVIINKFKGRVFYIYCDPELTLRQVWPAVEKKSWASNWERSSVEITRNDIIYLSQPLDTAAVLKALSKNDVVPATIDHFPFEQFPCLNEELPVNPTPTFDLSYGGTMRGGRRMKKMVQFYFGYPEAIKVEMFGKIELEDFKSELVKGLRAPIFSGPVRYDQMLPKMNQSLAHVVIGDPFYEQINDIPQRLYESIHSNVVTFIDGDMDRARRVFAADKQLADFLYVENRNQVAERISAIKEDNLLRREVLAAQKKAVGFDVGVYCSTFVGKLKHL